MKPIKEVKFVKEAMFGRKYMKWSCVETFLFLLKEGINKLIGDSYRYFSAWLFIRKWRKNGKDGRYFDFNGVKLSDVPTRYDIYALMFVFEDTFLSYCFFGDRYDKPFVESIDKHMKEGPYGYVDGAFDVTIKKGDVVIDAGAWMGDFSAYSAAKGATSYAFEPVEKTFQALCKTAEFYTESIHPVHKGLGVKPQELTINSGKDALDLASSIVIEKDYQVKEEKIVITTLDQFVAENNLTKIDFIKADIEGAERDMLRGASHVLKTFAPKLAICTYHLPDDPYVLEQIILDANPNYTVVHLRHKLFAMVTNKPTEV
ncbi:MAG: FkbM family methyltransferase [Tannerellaceae bacterium]|jgi:FkbM family methyltransferase|nr:FkbM family methyltransferase [Tannerellaceae bacterium]